MSGSGHREGLPFVKMHGLGNDFAIIDARGDETLAAVTKPGTASVLADRRKGIGCDQVICLQQSEADSSCFMRIINHDGSEVQACGNATRCVAFLLLEQVDEKSPLEEVSIRTVAGLLHCRRTPVGISVDMGRPGLSWEQIPLRHETDDVCTVLVSAGIACPSTRAFCVSIGNPHVVFVVPDATSVSLETIGPVFLVLPD